MLKEILERLMVENQEYQETPPQDQQEKSSYMTRLLSFFPVPSLKWRFVTTSPNTSSSFTGKPMQSSYKVKLSMFSSIFDLPSLKISRYLLMNYMHMHTSMG